MADVALNVRLNDREARASLQSFLSEIRKVETSGITLNINPQTASNVNEISQAFQRLSANNVFRSMQASGQAIDHVTQQIQQNRAVLQEQIALYGRYSDQASGVRTVLSDLGRELANLQRNHSEYEKRLQNTGAYNTFINETRKAVEEAERLGSAQAAVVRYVQGLNAGSKNALARYGIDLSTGSSGIPGGGYKSSIDEELDNQKKAVAHALQTYSKELREAKLTFFASALSSAATALTNFSGMLEEIRGLPGISGLSSFTSGLLNAPISGLTGSISSGFGGAGERYDILKNFPLVMQEVGFSSEEASESTEKLRDSILGLPIALNEVTETAQYFTLLTGDLEKATDLTIALNHAFIASGASQEQVSTGTRVLTYLLEGATLTTRQWFSLIRSMPVGLKYVGEALGYPDLRGFTKDLREGNVELDTFVDTLIDVGLNSTELNSILDIFKNRLSAAITNLGIAAQRMGASLLSGLNDALGGDAYGITGAIKEFGSVLDRIAKVGAEWITSNGAEIRDLVFSFIHYDWESFITGALRGFLDLLEKAFSYIEKISEFTGVDLFASLLTGGDAFISQLKIISSLLQTISGIINVVALKNVFSNFSSKSGSAFTNLLSVIKANPRGASAFGYEAVGSGTILDGVATPLSADSELGFLDVVNSLAQPMAIVTATIGTIELIKEAVDLANKGTDEADELIGEVNNSLDSMAPLNLGNFASNEQTMRGLIEAINSRIDENSAILSNVKSSGGWSTLLTRGVGIEELNSYREGNEKLRQQREEVEQRLLEYDRINSDPRYKKYITGLGDVNLNFMGVDTAQVISGIQNDVFNTIRDGEEINSYVLTAAESIIANADGWVEAYNLANNRVTSAQNEVSRIEEELAKVKEKTPATYTQISKYQSIWGKGNKYLSQQLEEDPEADFLYRNTRRDWLKLGTKGMQDLNDLKSWLISSFRNGKLTASQASIYGQMLDDLATDPAGNSKRIEKLKREIQESAQENTSFGWETWDDSFLQQEEGYNAQVLTYQEQQLSWELETAQTELTAAEEQLAVTVENLTNAFLETVRPIITNFVPGLWEMMFGEINDSDIEDEAEDAGEEVGNQISNGLTAGISSMDISSAIEAAQTKLETVIDSIKRLFNRNYSISGPSFTMNNGLEGATYVEGYGWVTDASGGSIPSFGTDTVPAMLTPGEYVHRRAAVQHYGKAFMDRINNLDLQGALATLSMSYVTPFATGGIVRSDNRSYRDNHASIVQNFNNSRSDYSLRRANRFMRGLA